MMGPVAVGKAVSAQPDRQQSADHAPEWLSGARAGMRLKPGIFQLWLAQIRVAPEPIGSFCLRMRGGGGSESSADALSRSSLWSLSAN